MTYVLWPTIRKLIYFLKCSHAVLYTALKKHVPLPRFPETFSMWYRIVFGTKWHRFHYCCNLWWVQPLYCINTLDYDVFLYGWENNREAGDLRRYRTHYDVILMRCQRASDAESIAVLFRPHYRFYSSIIVVSLLVIYKIKFPTQTTV